MHKRFFTRNFCFVCRVGKHLTELFTFEANNFHWFLILVANIIFFIIIASVCIDGGGGGICVEYYLDLHTVRDGGRERERERGAKTTTH